MTELDQAATAADREAENDATASASAPSLWQQLDKADSLESLVPVWLALQSELIGDVQHAIAAFDPGEDGDFAVQATWPPGRRLPGCLRGCCRAPDVRFPSKRASCSNGPMTPTPALHWPIRIADKIQCVTLSDSALSSSTLGASGALTRSAMVVKQRSDKR